MMCFMIGGMYVTVAMLLNRASEYLSRPERKRSVATAFVNSFGHTSYVYGSYLWPASKSPRNLKGFAASTAALGTASIMATLVPIFMYLPKRDEVARQGEVEEIDQSAWKEEA